MFKFSRAAGVSVSACVVLTALNVLPQNAAAEDQPQAQMRKSVEHFQRNVSMGCASGDCEGSVPLPKNGGTIRLNNISCLVVAGTGSEVLSGDLSVHKDGASVLTQYIGTVRSSSTGTHTLTQPMDVEIREGRTADVSIAVSSSGNPLAGCSVTGSRTAQ